MWISEENGAAPSAKSRCMGCEEVSMVIHDYLTTISCDKCSKEFQIERNLKENTIRRVAEKHGWRVVDGDDICPNCGARMDGE
jgi:hypothetical protein